MKSTEKVFPSLLLVIFLTVSVGAHAQQTPLVGDRIIQVDCDSPGGAYRSIQGTLDSLDPSKSYTLQVSGTCHENILIRGFKRLALIARPGASINDASGGVNDVVTVFDASWVRMRGFTVNGGADGIVCQNASLCQLSGNTFQNAGIGANIFRAQATFSGDVFQNNDRGLFLFTTADVWLGRVTVQNNTSFGAQVGLGSTLHLGAGSVVQNNLAGGIQASNNSTLLFGSATIRGNGGSGVQLLSSSVAQFGIAEAGSGNTITGNAGAGVDVGDLSFASFNGNTITGNHGAKDVVCRPQFSATNGALTGIGGGTTNCVEP